MCLPPSLSLCVYIYHNYSIIHNNYPWSWMPDESLITERKHTQALNLKLANMREISPLKLRSLMISCLPKVPSSSQFMTIHNPTLTRKSDLPLYVHFTIIVFQLLLIVIIMHYHIGINSYSMHTPMSNQ